jgi:hypothetical protein
MTTKPVPSRIRRIAAATMGLLGAALVAEAVLLATGAARGSLETPSTVIYDGIVVGAAFLCGLRAASRAEDRAAWTLLSLALTSWALGELYWDVVIGPSNNAPIPSPSDVFWLLFYPPAYVALARLTRTRLRQLPAAVLLDGLIGAFGVASVFAAVIFDTVLRHTHGRFGVVATGLAYPVGDLVLLALLVSVAVACGHALRSRAFLLIGVGVAVFCVGDAAYLVETATSTYHANHLLDVVWPLALVLISAAAWAPADRPASPRGERMSIVTPVALSLLSLGVLIVDHFQRTLSLYTHLTLPTT